MNNLVPDKHSGSNSDIENLLMKMDKRMDVLMKKLQQVDTKITNLDKKLSFIQYSMPLTEEERVRNRNIRMHAINGSVAPFFANHKR